MLLDLVFADKTILSCFFFFFLIIDLYFLISAVIAQVLNPIAELVIHIAMPTKETKVENKMLPGILEAKIRTFSI